MLTVHWWTFQFIFIVLSLVGDNLQVSSGCMITVLTLLYTPYSSCFRAILGEMPNKLGYSAKSITRLFSWSTFYEIGLPHYDGLG